MLYARGVVICESLRVLEDAPVVLGGVSPRLHFRETDNIAMDPKMNGTGFSAYHSCCNHRL